MKAYEEKLFGALMTIWKEMLAPSEVRENDNFFDLGGDSMKGVIALSLIQTQLGLDVPLNYVFEASTLGELNNMIIELYPENAVLDATRNALSADQHRSEPSDM